MKGFDPGWDVSPKCIPEITRTMQENRDAATARRDHGRGRLKREIVMGAQSVVVETNLSFATTRKIQHTGEDATCSGNEEDHVVRFHCVLEAFAMLDEEGRSGARRMVATALSVIAVTRDWAAHLSSPGGQTGHEIAEPVASVSRSKLLFLRPIHSLSTGSVVRTR